MNFVIFFFINVNDCLRTIYSQNHRPSVNQVLDVLSLLENVLCLTFFIFMLECKWFNHISSKCYLKYMKGFKYYTPGVKVGKKNQFLTLILCSSYKEIKLFLFFLFTPSLLVKGIKVKTSQKVVLKSINEKQGGTLVLVFTSNLLKKSKFKQVYNFLPQSLKETKFKQVVSLQLQSMKLVFNFHL